MVANPPFRDKRGSTGLDPANDPFERFQSFGTPLDKQGDYAYLLHIVRSLNATGKGACILPHGVLFRGGAEGSIRRNLVRKGYILGLIGLPANLFYGTGIPACIIVLDKQDAHARKGIFMIDASSGCIKDGPKNRLRDMDIHKRWTSSPSAKMCPNTPAWSALKTLRRTTSTSTCPATSTAKLQKTSKTLQTTSKAASPQRMWMHCTPTGPCARSCANRCSKPTAPPP